MKLIQPPDTCLYNVKSSDTLASIALRYNTTPTELSRLNHLASSLLFPGQTLFVPDKKKNDVLLKDKSLTPTVAHLPKDHARKTQSDPQKYGTEPLSIPIKETADFRLERLLDKDDLHSSPDEVSQKYLKISSKYVTDGQGVVSGILLVTPQTLMFNPDVSDHLVMDRGRDMYIVNAPLKSISSVSFFEDIAAMVCGEVEKQHIPCSSFIDYQTTGSPKPGVIVCQETGEAYTLSSPQNDNTQDTDFSNTKTEGMNDTKNNLENTENVHDCSKLETLDNITKDQGISTMSENEFSETTDPNHIETKDQLNKTNNDIHENEHEKTFFMHDKHSSSTPKHVASNNSSEIITNINEKDDINNVLETVESELNKINLKDNASDDITISSSYENDINIERTVKKDTPLSHSYDFSKDSGISDSTQLSVHESQESQNFHTSTSNNRPVLNNETRQWLGERGISFPSGDEEGSVKTPSDGELSPIEIIPRPAKKMTYHLLYVAVKIHKSYWCPSRTRHNVVMGIPPNRDQKRRQHWFAVPRERVDQLYAFLLHWAPDVNKVNSGFSTPGSEEHVLERSGEGEINFVDKFHNSPASTYGYEKLCKDDGHLPQYRPHNSLNSLSSKTSLRSLCEDEPDLLAESALLTKMQIGQLSRKLPSRTVGHSWELVYSTTIHGITLSTLYRNFQGYDSPVLIVVKDEHQKLFGAFMSQPPMVSEGFYGTGESMLFSFNKNNKIQIYNWTGENNFFIKGSKTSLAIGGGEGVFGLWLDEDLYRGRSHSCRTFENETLSEHEDFQCSGLEAWTFV